MSESRVSDTSLNKSTHYADLGGGRVGFLPPTPGASPSFKPTIGDFVQQQRTSPMNYQVYQLAGTVSFDQVVTDGKVYIDMGPLANLAYDQGISVVSMYTNTVTPFGADFTGQLILCAEFPYITGGTSSAQRRQLFLVGAGALAGASAGVHGQIDGTRIVQADWPPLPYVTGVTPLGAKPVLFWRNTGVADDAGAIMAYVINVIVVPAPRATVLTP